MVKYREINQLFNFLVKVDKTILFLTELIKDITSKNNNIRSGNLKRKLLGRYNNNNNNSDNFKKKIPKDVFKYFIEKNPDWDYLITGDYVILRVFDNNNKEFERIAARIVNPKYVKD